MSNNLDEVEVLLVEDNHDDAELTIRALKKYNITNNLLWLKDGEIALDFIFARNQYDNRKISNKPKLILLDLKLPKVSGLEFLQVLRSDERTKSIPVVVLTSSREELDIVSSYNMGINSYIVKPVEFDKFLKAVNEIGFYWLLLNVVD